MLEEMGFVVNGTSLVFSAIILCLCIGLFTYSYTITIRNYRELKSYANLGWEHMAFKIWCILLIHALVMLFLIILPFLVVEKEFVI